MTYGPIYLLLLESLGIVTRRCPAALVSFISEAVGAGCTLNPSTFYQLYISVISQMCLWEGKISPHGTNPVKNSRFRGFGRIKEFSRNHQRLRSSLFSFSLSTSQLFLINCHLAASHPRFRRQLKHIFCISLLLSPSSCLLPTDLLSPIALPLHPFFPGWLHLFIRQSQLRSERPNSLFTLSCWEVNYHLTATAIFSSLLFFHVIKPKANFVLTPNPRRYVWIMLNIVQESVFDSFLTVYQDVYHLH